jgi:hypothetical protein
VLTICMPPDSEWTWALVLPRAFLAGHLSAGSATNTVHPLIESSFDRCHFDTAVRIDNIRPAKGGETMWSMECNVTEWSN